MAEYDTDEERITAIMDFLKRNQRFILLTFGAVFFTAITSLSISSYYTNQNAQAAKLYDAWSIVESDEKIDLEDQDLKDLLVTLSKNKIAVDNPNYSTFKKLIK